ncbi:hypothetical protein AX14_010063 [Amanita brunnescens Koide BX004]|nr:hypothetical protein AX14_010063 [Amanita brunnescens Koide BX004]
MDMKTLNALVVVISFCCLSLVWRKLSKHRQLSAIPTVGHSGILSSYIGAFRFLKHAKEMAQEGYEKYHGSIFKIPMLTTWMIVVTSPQSIDDIRRASDDQLSLKDAIAESFHSDILFDPEMHDDDFHTDVIRSHLTRNIAARFSDIQDEIAVACSEYIPTKGNEWTTIVASTTVLSIVCRTVNRLLVGLPLCRDPDYRALNEQFTIDVVKAAAILNLFPTSLRHFVVHFLRKVPEGIERGRKHLEPLIKERLEQEAQYGDEWPDKPNDAISWFLEVAKEPRRRAIKNLTIRMLLVNFASIHTTTLAFTNALFNLATHPEYVQPMRKEVEAVIKEEGWSKSAIGKLKKVDSFVKESQRLAGNGIFSVKRKVLKDFTFSNGITIPAGYTISIPHRSIHRDPGNYLDPEIFDGFRFAKMREQEGESTKHLTVTTTPNYLTFGQGRHACPGRFFATNEVKTMLAYILLNYDVKMPDGHGHPSEMWFGVTSITDPTAEVMFRKRT